MAKPQKEHLRELAETERAALRRIVEASSERVDRVRRARALLRVAAGASFATAAREAGMGSGTTVANLVTRFNQHGLAALWPDADLRWERSSTDRGNRAGSTGSQARWDGHLVAVDPPEATAQGRPDTICSSATVAAWNEDPTPFTWGGKRKERRDRARQRRLGGIGSP